MQKVLKSVFMINDRLENNLKFWILLGPFFLIFSIMLATIDFAILSAISLFLCYRFKFKGLVISIIFLAIYSLYIQVNLIENHLWNLGLEVSICLGLITASFGFEEIKNFLSLKDESLSMLHSDFENLKKEMAEKKNNFDSFQFNLQENIKILKSDLAQKNQNISVLKEENQKLNKELEKHKSKQIPLEVQLKDKEIEDLKNIQDELYEKISYLKDEEFLDEKNKQLEREIDNLKNILKKEEAEKSQLNEKFLNKANELKNLEAKMSDFDSLQNEINRKNNQIDKLKQNIKTLKDIQSPNSQDIEQLNKINSLYLQLKNQFEEKKLLLHKTRQELFYTKEKLTAYQKEKKDNCKDLNELEKTLIKDLDESQKEIEQYLNENQNLEDLIYILLQNQETKSKKTS